MKLAIFEKMCPFMSLAMQNTLLPHREDNPGSTVPLLKSGSILIVERESFKEPDQSNI